MKILLFTDPHIADRAPSSCTGTYTDDLFDLMDQISAVAVKLKVTAIVIAGDVFHIKSPSRTSHRLVQRMIRQLKSMPVIVYVVPGNHDITHDRIESLAQTQPLGVLFESGAARILDGWAEYDGPPGTLPLYGVPWLQGYGNYAEAGEQVDSAVGRAFRDWREQGTGKELVVAHAPLYPPGQESPYEWFPAERWAEVMGGSGSVFYGHVHEPHGVWTAGGVEFCNNGALSRGSLHEYNLTRQVGGTAWDSATGEFEFIPLDARPAGEVFRLAEKDEIRDMSGRLEEFLAGVGSAQLELVSVESMCAHIRTLGLGREAEALAIELLTEAASDGGK